MTNTDEFLFNEDILSELPSFKKRKLQFYNLPSDAESSQTMFYETDDNYGNETLEITQNPIDQTEEDGRFYGGSHYNSNLMSETKTLSISIDGETDGEDFSLEAHSEISQDGKKSISDVSLEYKDGKGSYKTDIDGNKTEGNIDADNYEEFLSKMYATLLMSSNSPVKSEDSSISSTSTDGELIVEIDHNKN